MIIALLVASSQALSYVIDGVWYTLTAPFGTSYTPVRKKKYHFKRMSPILIILTFGQQKCEMNAPSLFEHLTGKLHHTVLSMHSFELQVYGNLLIILDMHNRCVPGCFSRVRLSAHTFSSSLTVFLKEFVCICVKTVWFAYF